MYSKKLWQTYNFLGMWIILQSHESKCHCYWCTERSHPKRKGISLNLPINKRKNSWRRLSYHSGNGKSYYLRWTLPKWCK
jgi:hypothetical protein